MVKIEKRILVERIRNMERKIAENISKIILALCSGSELPEREDVDLGIIELKGHIKQAIAEAFVGIL